MAVLDVQYTVAFSPLQFEKNTRSDLLLKELYVENAHLTNRFKSLKRSNEVPRKRPDSWKKKLELSANCSARLLQHPSLCRLLFFLEFVLKEHL